MIVYETVSQRGHLAYEAVVCCTHGLIHPDIQVNGGGQPHLSSNRDVVRLACVPALVCQLRHAGAGVPEPVVAVICLAHCLTTQPDLGTREAASCNDTMKRHGLYM